MKRRTVTALVALAVIGWCATRSDATSLLVTENSTSAPDFKEYTGTAGTAATLMATQSTNMSNPFGITTDASGNVYVVNNGSAPATINSVSQYTPGLAPNGFFIPANTSSTFLNSPVDMAIKPTTSNAYITQFGPTGSGGAILQQNLSGASPGTFTSNGANGGLLALPFALAFNTTDRTFNPSTTTNPYLYVTNEGASQTSGGGYVNVYNTASSRAPILQFGGPQLTGPLNAQNTLNTPTGIAFDSSGNVYVANITSTGANNIQEYNAAGSFLGTFVLTGSAGLSGPQGMLIDPSTGNLFVANAGGFVSVFSSTGTLFATNFASGLMSPEFLTLAPTAVPEPASIAMLGLGQVGLLGFWFLRNRRKANRGA